jgi:uncharacterized protein YfbU (UPF0304 family)
MTDKPAWTYDSIDDILEKYRHNHEVWESVARAYQLGLDDGHSVGYKEGIQDGSDYPEHYA